MIQKTYTSKVLQDAVEAIGSLPGIGDRSALRLALHLIRQNPDSIHRFASAVDRLADGLHYCRECAMLCDEDICPVCADPSRDHRTICVVESIRDVMSVEETGEFRGVYHVLGGKISPIDGIGPSDLSIAQLVERIRNTEGQVEIIFALSTDVEGETTSFYIYRQIEALGCKVSSLARGLGFGSDLEYADSFTLGMSIANRQPFKI